MVAINFQPQFVGLISAGEKRQTIRRTARCKPGDALQLYTGQRTKFCRKIGDAVCQSVEPILIDEVLTRRGGKLLSVVEMVAMAHADGFKKPSRGASNVAEFIQFFDDRYGLPFEGWLIQWRDFVPVGIEA